MNVGFLFRWKLINTHKHENNENQKRAYCLALL